MKKNTAEAQVVIPLPSPKSILKQKVGLTDISVEYFRPRSKGRAIFGNLVPYGKIWRTAANANTKITFSTDISFDGHFLKKGTYALFAIPDEKSWEMIFYSDTENWGAPNVWHYAKIAAQLKITPQVLPMKIDTFTIAIDDITDSSAVLGLLWDNTYAGIKFEVPTDDIVIPNIKNTLAENPKAMDYYFAAVYYSRNNKDIKQAGEWMEKAMSMMERPSFRQLRQQSIIYAKIGMKEKAVEVARRSLEDAKVAKDEEFINLNMASLKEWGAI
ncbi:MAG: DUF2911 domain-containing protein [Flavobacteriaceae bacterium]|nr:MAG: DUF2911 domain-containing protein [Flavobacteriaceae bacterium]